MKGQVRGTAVAAVALKPSHKTLLVWNPAAPVRRQRERVPLASVLGMLLRQLLLSGMTASSEQGFSVCLPHHFTPGLWADELSTR